MRCKILSVSNVKFQQLKTALKRCQKNIINVIICKWSRTCAGCQN